MWKDVFKKSNDFSRVLKNFLANFDNVFSQDVGKIKKKKKWCTISKKFRGQFQKIVPNYACATTGERLLKDHQLGSTLTIQGVSTSFNHISTGCRTHWDERKS